MNISYQFWNENYQEYPLFVELLKKIAPEQLQFVVGAYYREHKNYLFVALSQNKVVGFIRYCRQPIGPEAKCPPIKVGTDVLWEAKINAFAVDLDFRGMNIGKTLQQIVLSSAKKLGCYQVASYSTLDKVQNYSVKLSLGFGVQMETQLSGVQGAYFIMPLKSWVPKSEINWEAPGGAPVI